MGTSEQKITLILPCSGFGTRMKMQQNEAKEMLLYEDAPIIDWCLKLGEQYVDRIIVNSRNEKHSLNNYLSDKQNVQLMYNPGKEWSETVYNTKDYWSDINILILPDTRWENIDILKDMIESVKNGNNVAFGVFPVKDRDKWSIIENERVIEKPSASGDGLAWGCIAVSKEYGKVLFKALQEKNKAFKLDKFSCHNVVNFRDITRGTNGYNS